MTVVFVTFRSLSAEAAGADSALFPVSSNGRFEPPAIAAATAASLQTAPEHTTALRGFAPS